MSTLSLREIAGSCLGVSGTFSVARDVFGYVYGEMNETVSLRKQLTLAKGPCINLSIVLVGHRDDFSGFVTLSDVRAVQVGIHIAREIYGKVDLGIRKIYWQRISPEDAGNYATINDSSEGKSLTEDWSSPTDGLDVFFCPQVNGADGWSDLGGTCDKGAKDAWTGTVCELGMSPAFTGVLLAHEVGHYLGLDTGPSIQNVMGEDPDGDNIDSINSNSTDITTAQGDVMKAHCYVQGSCG